MKRKRFTWNRKSYRQADHLARMFARFNLLPHDEPEILRKYFELWERHRQYDDPLMTSNIHNRLGMSRDGIPF